MLKKILLALVVVVGGFLAFAATRPDTYHVERSTTIEAPPDVVFAQLDDFKAWSAWSPWEKMDPGMQKTFSGPPKGVGATYAWQGNDKVGKGSMTVTESAPPHRLACRLEFIEPFASVAQNGFTVEAEGAGGSRVTWAMDGRNNLVSKAFGVFMNMDKMIGDDFEKGLAALKTVAESAAAKARAEAEAAAAAAKAKADAEAKVAAEAEAQAQAAREAEAAQRPGKKR